MYVGDKQQEQEQEQEREQREQEQEQEQRTCSTIVLGGRSTIYLLETLDCSALLRLPCLFVTARQ